MDETSWLTAEPGSQLGRKVYRRERGNHGLAAHSLLRKLWLIMTSTAQDNSG